MDGAQECELGGQPHQREPEGQLLIAEIEATGCRDLHGDDAHDGHQPGEREGRLLHGSPLRAGLDPAA
jgi:hypothetical protein